MTNYICELAPEYKKRLKNVVTSGKVESWSANVESVSEEGAKSEAVREFFPLIQEAGAPQEAPQTHWFLCSEINE